MVCRDRPCSGLFASLVRLFSIFRRFIAGEDPKNHQVRVSGLTPVLAFCWGLTVRLLKVDHDHLLVHFSYFLGGFYAGEREKADPIVATWSIQICY
jgi:hypothetical protein